MSAQDSVWDCQCSDGSDDDEEEDGDQEVAENGENQGFIFDENRIRNLVNWGVSKIYVGLFKHTVYTLIIADKEACTHYQQQLFSLPHLQRTLSKSIDVQTQRCFLNWAMYGNPGNKKATEF